MVDGIFGNLLGGYVAGVDKQRELAQQLAQQEFQKAQFEYSKQQDVREYGFKDTEQRLRGRIHDDTVTNQTTDNIRDMYSRIETAWKNGANGKQIRGMYAPYAQQLGVELPDVDTWGENPIIAEKRRHNEQMESALFARFNATERTKYMKMHADYVKDLMFKGGISEVDARNQANSWLSAVLGDSTGAGMPTATPQPEGAAPMGGTGTPTGFDLLGMLSGYTPAAPTMPAGVTQGLTGNYDPTKVAPGVANNMEYKANAADVMASRAALNTQDVDLRRQKNQREIEKMNLTRREKDDLHAKNKAELPHIIAERIQRIAESKSRVNYRVQQIQRQKQNDAFLNDYRKAKTAEANNPGSVKEWGLKERVQLETRKSKAQSEWRQNEKMLQDLMAQQRGLLYGKTLEQLEPADRATYQTLQESIDETDAMKEASKADYYQYQQMAKEVGFFKPNTPQGLAERGRVNPRDLPVQPRNMGTNRPRITPEAEVRARQPKGSRVAPLKTTEKVFNVNGKTVKVRRIN